MSPLPTPSRRALLAGAGAAAVALAARPLAALAPRPPAAFAPRPPAALAPRPVAAQARDSQDAAAAPPFGMHFAPHLGMFAASAGGDPLDQIRFMRDQGFTAFEDNGMAGRPVEVQTAIGELLAALGMRMGVFVGNSNGFGAPSFTAGRAADRERFLADLRNSVEVSKRVGARWCTIVLGDLEPRLQPEYQTANVIETLRQGCAICEPAGLVMVIEPLNPWRDHPGMFLQRIPQAYMLCRAVDSPSCKILFDLYHQQITEGNLIPNIDRAWDEIAYFQVGDNPGRNEPGTGEIDYRNVFRHIHAKGYDGILGMEHGNSRPGLDGERAVIEAYRRCDVR